MIARLRGAPHGLSELAWALLLESSFRVYATSGGYLYREAWFLGNRLWLYSAARNPASYARKLDSAVHPKQGARTGAER